MTGRRAPDPAPDGPFVHDLPNGIVLPAFVTGARMRGVRLGDLVTVPVDVAPGSDLNRIDLKIGTVAVAVLSSAALDAADVDVASLRFGPDGAGASGDELQDVNGDGIADRISRHRTAETGLALGDGEACLVGKRLDGRPFTGCDAVQVVAGTPSCGLGPELAFVMAPLVWRLRRRSGVQRP